MKPHRASGDIVSTSRIYLVLGLSIACYETFRECLSR